MNIHIVDNFFPDKLVKDLDVLSDEYKFEFSRSDNNLDIYWTLQLYGENYRTTETKNNIEEFTKNEIKLLWDYFALQFNLNIFSLNSCYINVLSHGVEAYPHIDFAGGEGTTVILYICDEWNCYWSGETVFYSNEWASNPADTRFYNNEIIKSVLPRKNRILIFDGNITHSVRPLSKTYKGLRKTLMFKLKNIPINKLMENYKCNLKMERIAH
jgi:hypothetical protein